MPKIMIDIPQAVLDENNGNLHFKVGFVNGVVDYAGTKDYNFKNIVIPDNVTNGDIIKSLYDCEIYEPIEEANIIHVLFKDFPNQLDGFYLDWWNTPYKGDTDGNKNT